MDLSAKIEALLFFKAEPISEADLARMLEVSSDDVREALKTLAGQLSERGVSLIRNNDAVTLATTEEAAPLIERVGREELEKDLGKAGMEVLTIVLYRAPVTRSQVDYIRGVNSTYTLRHLLVRGLIEKIPNLADQRSYLYRPTFDLLRLLGLSRIEDLPEYTVVRAEMDEFEKRGREQEEPASIS